MKITKKLLFNCKSFVGLMLEGGNKGGRMDDIVCGNLKEEKSSP